MDNQARDHTIVFGFEGREADCLGHPTSYAKLGAANLEPNTFTLEYVTFYTYICCCVNIIDTFVASLRPPI